MQKLNTTFVLLEGDRTTCTRRRSLWCDQAAVVGALLTVTPMPLGNSLFWCWILLDWRVASPSPTGLLACSIGYLQHGREKATVRKFWGICKEDDDDSTSYLYTELRTPPEINAAALAETTTTAVPVREKRRRRTIAAERWSDRWRRWRSTAEGRWWRGASAPCPRGPRRVGGARVGDRGAAPRPAAGTSSSPSTSAWTPSTASTGRSRTSRAWPTRYASSTPSPVELSVPAPPFVTAAAAV